MENNFAEFKDIAENVFAPIYPVIARNIVETTGIIEGACIEIGAGTGILSRALSKITRLSMFALDMSKDMCKLLKHYNGKKYPLEPIAGNVEELPVKSLSADLVISRGSVFFWSDLNMAFSEIYRVLKPGGTAYIGGGFGNKALKEHVEQRMKIIKPSWHSENNKRIARLNLQKVDEIMKTLKIHSYHFINDDTGIWILMKKEEGDGD